MGVFSDQWIELERIFSSGVRREKELDSRLGVNWDELEQITIGAAVGEQ